MTLIISGHLSVSLIYLQLILCRLRNRVHFNSSAIVIQSDDEDDFSPGYIFGYFFINNQVAISMWTYIWVLNAIVLVDMLIFMLTQGCSHYYMFVI